MSHCWDYHHIEPVRAAARPNAHVAKVLSFTILVLGLIILGLVTLRWWQQTAALRGYVYRGSDTRLSGLWVPTNQQYHGHPVFRKTTGDMYLYHGSVPSDRSLWIFSTSLAEGEDAAHVAYASGPHDTLSNFLVTGNGHVGRMVPH